LSFSGSQDCSAWAADLGWEWIQMFGLLQAGILAALSQVNQAGIAVADDSAAVD